MLKYPALFVRFCMLVCAGLLANLAWAANPIATSNAFDALLSLPQTQPVEGEWNHVAPEGFKGEDEATLIRWLAKQKQAGADFNQIRHQGTMLHHAIRGGLNATALWLLSHGADPLKTLENGEQDQPDALDLSITYRRWPVTDALLKLPGITAPERAPQLMLAWQAAQGENELKVVDQLFARRLPLPTGAAAEKLLGFSLEHQWLKVSLALLKNGVTHAASSAYGWDSANKMGTASDIESADALLSAPIFPYLLAHAISVRDVEWLWGLHIRRPFGDAAFTRQVVLRILAVRIPAPIKRALLERLPPVALKTAFNDEEVLYRWMRWSAELPPAEGDWAFSVLGDLPTRRPIALLNAMLKDAYWFDENANPANAAPAAGWARLLASLHAPLPVEMNGKLWMFVPRTQRPILLRMGYKPSDKELVDWLARNNKDTIFTLWPQLKAAMPELTARIHEPLLAPYTPENGCYGGGMEPEVLDKARVLMEASTRPRKPVVLDTGCVAVTSPAILQALKAAGLITLQPPSPAEMHRFVVEAPNCRFNANEVWRRSLIKTRSLGDIPIDGMQVISVPGEADCALLVWGGDAGGRVDYEEDGFTGMQHLSPCGDGHHATAILRVTGNTLQQTELGEDMPAIQGALPLQDSVSGDHILLVGEIGTGTCGSGTPRQLLSWQNSPEAKPRLLVLPRKSATMQAFLRQCGRPTDAETQDCFPPADDGTTPNISFIDQHWARDRKAYLDAVLSLDYAVLRSEQKLGIFPEWLVQAIDAISKANMPVEDKRKRTAWLFRDPALLAQAMQTSVSYEMQTGLVAWLPREDWRPVIKALHGNYSMLDSLRTQAEGQGKPALACTLANALGRVCSKVQPAAN